MKDFTTTEFIKPIIEEFTSVYKNITTDYYKKHLNCDLLFEKGKHNATAVRRNQAFHYYGKSVIELEKKIRDFAKCAETYEGELDKWEWNEEERVQNAIRDELLKLYA